MGEMESKHSSYQRTPERFKVIQIYSEELRRSQESLANENGPGITWNNGTNCPRNTRKDSKKELPANNANRANEILSAFIRAIRGPSFFFFASFRVFRGQYFSALSLYSRAKKKATVNRWPF
ncbi:MAG: hypothetical protein DMF63_15005 [Acidobacteria bacterium]|nr:MAG: hypothetical protein DMF63_15005 [Acidobacteriota bacterium]